MTEYIHVPCSLLRHVGARLELVARVAGSGMTGEGFMPLTNTSGGGLWRMEFEALQLTEPAYRKAWRAISGLCDGGANKLIVPFCDPDHTPWPVVDGEEVRSYGSIPFSDESFFSDGTGFYQPVISATASAAAALRATTLSIVFSYGGPVGGGEHFSIHHPTMGDRIYRIVKVDGATVTIRPPLREAIEDGTDLDFDEPKGVFQPATPDALDIFTDIIGVARPSPKLIEAF